MNKNPRCVIIVAGGSGSRMGMDIPKQFLLLAGKPILMHTIEVFYRYDSKLEIIVVLPYVQHNYWKDLCEKYKFTLEHRLTHGGKTRFDSVKNGMALAPQNGVIAVHDGVRPLVSQATIGGCFEAMQHCKAAIPVVPVTESIRQKTNHTASIPVDRELFSLVQTPQVFDAQMLHQCYQQSYQPEFTDDASVVEKMGIKVELVDGNFENIKITRPIDLKIAETLIDK